MTKNSLYQQGHDCSICGIHLDSSESYSARPPRFEVVCKACDVDLHTNQKRNEE